MLAVVWFLVGLAAGEVDGRTKASDKLYGAAKELRRKAAEEKKAQAEAKKES